MGLPEAVVRLWVGELRESVIQLSLHCVPFTPQFTVDANVPVFIEHQEISTVVQHTQVLHARRLHATGVVIRVLLQLHAGPLHINNKQ